MAPKKNKRNTRKKIKPEQTTEDLNETDTESEPLENLKKRFKLEKESKLAENTIAPKVSPTKSPKYTKKTNCKNKQSAIATKLRGRGRPKFQMIEEPESQSEMGEPNDDNVIQKGKVHDEIHIFKNKMFE